MNQSIAATTLTEADTVLTAQRVQQLLASMGFTAAAVRCQSKPPHLYIHIEAGTEGNLLIGLQGAHLVALQHIVRSILRPTAPSGTRIIVDVNGYRARREQELVEIAEAAAARAVREGQIVTLSPMTPADRRVVHTALANRSDVRTMSVGSEPRRAVVVKPVSL